MDRRIVTRKVSTVSTRGVVVIDRNISGIAEELRNKNMIIISMPPGVSQERILEAYLPGRILITDRSEDFIYHASSYEFGIIALDDITFKDDLKRMVEMINLTIIKKKLWSKKYGFIIKLNDMGEGLVKNLID